MRHERKIKKICICGHFANGVNMFDGQTLKTKRVCDALIQKYTTEEIVKIDTYGSIISWIRLPFLILHNLIHTKNFIFLTAHNGLKIIPRLLLVCNYLFKRKLHYIVIGGWLPQYLEKRHMLMKSIKKLDRIYVETKTMKNQLNRMGFHNVEILPNIKEPYHLPINIEYNCNEYPLRLCIFSRIMKEKGIEDAIEAINKINSKASKTIYSLDIYGQIDANQMDWFKTIENHFPEYIKYKGIVESKDSSTVLTNYFCLLFPTRFYTEGIPGTILDAYAAGLPIIYAKWINSDDVLIDGYTGLAYKFGDNNQLYKILQKVATDPMIINTMRQHCREKAIEYSPEHVIELLSKNLA